MGVIARLLGDRGLAGRLAALEARLARLEAARSAQKLEHEQQVLEIARLINSLRVQLQRMSAARAELDRSSVDLVMWRKEKR